MEFADKLMAARTNGRSPEKMSERWQVMPMILVKQKQTSLHFEKSYKVLDYLLGALN